MRFVSAAVALALAGCGTAAAQGWAPQKNVEIVVGSAAGGSNDRTGRFVERMLREHKLVDKSITVVNRPGGGTQLAFAYMNQHQGDAHYLLVGTTALLTSYLTGQGKYYYVDFTPVASLFNDYTVYAVNASSPMASGKDLLDRLRKDPGSVSTGFATALGSHNHIAACLLLKALGANPRQLKAVAFKGAAEAVTQLLGGHLDLVTTAAGNAARHVESGRMRVLAVGAPRRLGGVLANVPTWRELGTDVVIGGWRAIVAPKGITPAQVAYWEGVLKKATQVPEWRSDLEKNYWTDDFVGSAQFAKDIEKDYAEMKAILTDLGLAKTQ
ncbi:MAG: tripartite tricarboxylate transporter substrate binding protein [Burkholderiales bacterium]|nr:tripartite tricarboxylate transporter substrate binding protein [Burkholderiales bacterium]